MRKKIYFSLIISVLLIFFSNNIQAQENGRIYSDSVYLRNLRDSLEASLQRSEHRSEIRDKKIKFKPLVNLDYSPKTKFGVSAGVVGEYLTGEMPGLPISNVSIEIGYTTNNSHFGEIKGRNFNRSNKWIVDYILHYSSLNSYFWGIGYDNNSIAENKSEYTRVNAIVGGELRYRITRQLSVGPLAGFNYSKGKKFTRPDLIEGFPLSFRGTHAGIHLNYDSRDDTYFPTKGINARFVQRFYPNIFFDITPYYSTEFIFDTFLQVWSSAILAIDVTGEFNFGDVPWTFYPQMGGHNRMRGYYKGKYTDKNLITAQAELRQTIFGNHRVVLWAGAGNIFPSFGEFRPDHTMPTFGIGYRLQPHKRLILRIDFGMGCNGQNGFSLGLKEAF